MRTIAIGLGLLVLAGCGGPTPAPANEAAAANGADAAPVAANDSIASGPIANEAAPGNHAAPAATPIADGKLPAAFQGRWGLVPADCTTTNGDEKGLMTVTADRLAFYESRATVTRLAAVSPTELKATLAFSGEGQTWTEETPLVLGEGGTTLTRTSHEGQTLRYTRCEA